MKSQKSVKGGPDGADLHTDLHTDKIGNFKKKKAQNSEIFMQKLKNLYWPSPGR